VYQQSEEVQNFTIEELNKYRDQMIQVFDVRIFNKMIKNFPIISKPEGNPPLFNENPALINEFLMRVQLTKTMAKINVNFLNKLKNSAQRLKKNIGKKYLENE
jgi:hypothetical protein